MVRLQPYLIYLKQEKYFSGLHYVNRYSQFPLNILAPCGYSPVFGLIVKIITN